MIESTPTQKQQAAHVRIEKLLFAMVLLGISLFWSYRVGVQANGLDHILYHETENLKGIRKHVAEMEAKLR